MGGNGPAQGQVPATASCTVQVLLGSALPMQVRLVCDLASDQYINQKAWKKATILTCPLHPEGGCGFCKNGTYERMSPPGARIARCYCSTGHQTFSLIPDCLAALFPGTLHEIEGVVVKYEKFKSVKLTADEVRENESDAAVDMVSAIRWVFRRVNQIKAVFIYLIAAMPEEFGTCAATLESFRKALKCEKSSPVLPILRNMAHHHLHVLPPPVGFGPKLKVTRARQTGLQHSTGKDPPPVEGVFRKSSDDGTIYKEYTDENQVEEAGT